MFLILISLEKNLNFIKLIFRKLKMKSSKFNAAIEQWAKTIPGNTPKHEVVILTELNCLQGLK